MNRCSKSTYRLSRVRLKTSWLVSLLAFTFQERYQSSKFRQIISKNTSQKYEIIIHLLIDLLTFPPLFS